MRARFALLAVGMVASTLVFGACAYDWTFYGPGSGDAGSEAGGGRDSSAVDGGRTEDVSVPPPLPGECNFKVPCANGGFCDFQRYDCGQNGEPGKCNVPGPCPVGPGIAERVCGCNGLMYTSICEANGALQELAEDGRCNASALKDPALFQCGYRFCLKATELCEVIKGAITEYKCVPLCPKADCTCVTGCSGCSGSADGGGITAICP